ncbi:MAG: lipopolysaccharide biosynthesis protein [Oscillospiraceae bacterium]|nr:lipopolysaccharide biosynthesis protein [Oscillospiraceae bacterium]
MARTQNSIRNVLSAMIGQLGGILVNLLARVFFLHYLNQTYLGLNGLFTNVLTMLSLVELGVGPAMAYSLYKPLADHDVERLKSHMAFYKKAYVTIGLAIAALGLAFLPFYTVFMDEVPDIPHLNTIYLLFVANTVVSYFYSYKRSLIICDQKKYIETAVHYGAYFLLNVVQIIFLALTKNYVVFLMLQVLSTWLENFILARKADKLYPFLREKNVRPMDKTDSQVIFRNVAAMSMHKVGAVVVNSTDNILISKLIGLASAGLYSNYYTIIHPLQTITNQIFESIVASVGNLTATVKDGNVEHLMETFYDVFFFAFWIFTFCSICLLNLLHPFIEFMWLRNRGWLLDNATLYVLVLNFYLYGMRRPVLTFRDATGAFWNDRFKPIFESIINLVASILLAKPFGIAGIFLGTLVSTVTTSLWVEPMVLYHNVFYAHMRKYFARFFSYTAVGLVICVITTWLCSHVGYSLISILPRALICLTVPNLLLLVVFYRTKEFQYFRRLGKTILGKVKRHDR